MLTRYPMPQARRRGRYGDPFAWTLLISLILHALVLAVRFGLPGSESGPVQALIEPLQILLEPEQPKPTPNDTPATRIDPDQPAQADAQPAITAPPLPIELVVTLVQKPAPEATAPKPKARQSVARKATRMRTATPVMTTHQDGKWAVQTDPDTTEPAPVELADAPIGSANVDIPADPATPPAIPAVTSEPTTQDDTALAAAEAERQQAEELARAEQARVAAALAAAEKERAEQQAKAEAARKAAIAAEQQRKEEAAKLATEAARKKAEELARAEAAKLAMAQQAAAEKQRAEEVEKQRLAAEQTRQAEARKQAEEQAKAEAARKAAEQQAAIERKRTEEAARQEQARIAEAARQQAEQQARAETARKAAEQAAQEKQRAEAAKAEQARVAAEAAAKQRAQEESARAEAARKAEQQAAAEKQRQEDLARAEQARAAAEAQKRAEETARAEQARKVAAEQAAQAARAAAESAAQSGKGSGSGVAGSGNNPGSGNASNKGITVPLALPPSFSLAERALQQVREREPVRDPFDDKRPRMRTAELSRSHIATETDFRFYSESFKLKVERVGALNPPRFIKGDFQMSLVLTAVINSDGSLANVYIKQGSGDKRIDDAAKRIVVSSSPFAPFSPRMMERYDQVEITRTWNFVDGRTSLAY